MPIPKALKEPMKYIGFFCLARAGKWLCQSSVPILTYHSLDESQSPISIAPSAFHKQMLYLKAQGFRTIALTDFVQILSSAEPFPEKSFVLTFDDGFRSVYDVAFPLLSKLDFTATIFLVTDFIGQTCSWEVSDKIRKLRTDRLPLLTIKEVTEMHRYGFSFGSHGSRHFPLTQLETTRVRLEIQKSKCAIENILGSPCQLFCYPYGAFDDSLRRILQETGFEGAVTTLFGLNNKGSDPYALLRIGSAHFTSMPVFQASIYGTYGWHLR